MKKRDLMLKLQEIAKANQLDFYEDGGAKHEKWLLGGAPLAIPRHKEVDEYTARRIIKQANGIAESKSEGDENGR
jgi:hypothetical protein